MVKKHHVTVLVVLLLLVFCTALADGFWYCPVCGQKNYYSFCSRDGTPQPNPATPSDLPTDGQTDIQADDSLPLLSETFPGVAAWLRSLEGNSRAFSFGGPGYNYSDTGGYKPAKQVRITAFFVYDGWVLADVSYATAEERYVYLRKSSFDHLSTDVPEIQELPGYDGVTTAPVEPSWGPSEDFNTSSDHKIPEGTSFIAFFQENGYVYAEFTCAKGKTRMWLPADHVNLFDTAR